MDVTYDSMLCKESGFSSSPSAASVLNVITSFFRLPIGEAQFAYRFNLLKRFAFVKMIFSVSFLTVWRLGFARPRLSHRRCRCEYLHRNYVTDLKRTMLSAAKTRSFLPRRWRCECKSAIVIKEFQCQLMERTFYWHCAKQMWLAVGINWVNIFTPSSASYQPTRYCLRSTSFYSIVCWCFL